MAVCPVSVDVRQSRQVEASSRDASTWRYGSGCEQRKRWRGLAEVSANLPQDAEMRPSVARLINLKQRRSEAYPCLI